MYINQDNKDLEKKVYNAKEVAQLLDIGMNKSYELMNSKNFPAIRIGRKIVVPIKAFDTWLENQSRMQ